MHEETEEKARRIPNVWKSGMIAGAFDEIDPQCDPLGPNNKLIFATSPLDGLGITCAGRLSVGGKSPLTGGIKESNAGGVSATKLVRQGIKAIIVEDLPQDKEIHVLHIDRPPNRSAGHLAGLNHAVARKFMKSTEGRD
jgi:aldehyde:ferredoxin oxidoreductase